jgi:hypothetical protein
MRKIIVSLSVVSMISVSFASCEKKIKNTKDPELIMESSICGGMDVKSTKDSVCIDSIPDCVLTQYFYMTADGSKYPIYQSREGKCFIIRTNTKTGERYRQYLPEVDMQLNRK